jgi:hypothetical protein
MAEQVDGAEQGRATAQMRCRVQDVVREPIVRVFA